MVTPLQILEVASEHFERDGYRAKVTEVAVSLGVKRSAIRRFFPLKLDLYDKVAEVRLRPETGGLRAIAERKGPAVPILLSWFAALRENSASAYLTEPMYLPAANGYVEEALDQLTEIIRRGSEAGELHHRMKPRAAACFALQTTNAFHGLAFNMNLLAFDWGPEIVEGGDEDDAFETAMQFVMSALEAHAPLHVNASDEHTSPTAPVEKKGVRRRRSIRPS